MQINMTCMICFDSVDELVILSCGCKLCPQCLTNWFNSQIETSIYSKQIKVPCPFPKCKKNVPINEARTLLSKQHFDQISDNLFNHYVITTDDIRRCPAKGCNYAGTILKKRCSAKLQCKKCDFTWSDPSQMTYFALFLQFIFRISQAKADFLSNIRKMILGESCPNCQTVIIKNGGCPHMVCSHCKYEFCWFCFAHYPSYRHEKGNYCGLRIFYYFFLIPVLLIISSSKLFTTSSILRDIILFILKFLILSVFTIIYTILHGFYLLVIDNHSRYKRGCYNSACPFYTSLIGVIIGELFLTGTVIASGLFVTFLKIIAFYGFIVVAVICFILYVDSIHRSYRKNGYLFLLGSIAIFIGFICYNYYFTIFDTSSMVYPSYFNLFSSVWDFGIEFVSKYLSNVVHPMIILKIWFHFFHKMKEGLEWKDYKTIGWSILFCVIGNLVYWWFDLIYLIYSKMVGLILLCFFSTQNKLLLSLVYHVIVFVWW